MRASGTFRFAASLVLLCIVAPLSAYATTINPPAPATQATLPLPPIANSSIAIPINIDTVALGHEIEGLLSTGQGAQSIYWEPHKNLGGGKTLQVGVSRTGPVAVSTDGGCVNLTVPFATNQGRVQWEKIILHARVSAVGTFDAGLNFNVRACFGVAPNWHLESTLTPSYVWTTAPIVQVHLRFGNVPIHVQDILSQALNQRLPAITASLQSKFAAIDLEQVVGKAWTAVQHPLQISADPNITANVDVASIGVGPFTSQGVNLVVRPNLVAKLSAQLGAPTTARTEAPLPPNSGQVAQDGFAVSVRIDAPYERLNKELADHALNHEFPISVDQHVTFTDVHVGPLGDKLLIKASFKAKLSAWPLGDVDGWLYLTGKPKYDDATRVLSIDVLGFDASTDSLIVNIVDPRFETVSSR
jgi:hypothetical protein